MTVSDLKGILQFEAKEIRNHRERIAALRSRVGSAKDLRAGPVQGGASGDLVCSAACEIVRLEGEMQGHIDRVYGQYLVHCDTHAQREVLRHRYIEGLEFKEIPLWVPNCRERKAYYLHSEALAVICEKLQIVALQSKV